jgi:hypothetical protein
MVDIFSVVLVGSVITFFMYQNINKVTAAIDEKTRDNSPAYAKFAVKIQEVIRGLKKDLDEDIECSDPRFCKNDSCDEKVVMRELNELIRKASFYETALAKNKKRKEADAEFIEILQRLEAVIETNCLHGAQEAEKIKDELFAEYQEVLG